MSRLAAALDGRPVDHLPFAPNLAYWWEAQPAVRRDAGQLAFLHEIGADPLWRGAPCPVQATCPGAEITVDEDERTIRIETATPVGTLREVLAKSQAGNTSFLVEHPLRTRADFEVQMWIEEHTRFSVDLTPVAEHFAGPGAEGLSVGMLIPRLKSAFQHLVENRVGTEELIYALADYPDTVNALWELMVARDLEAVQLALAAGYDYFLTWEDSGTQNYSPALYDRYIAPEISAWCATLAAAGRRYLQHACGHVRRLLVPMRDSGVYGVESISPPPTGNVTIAEARRLAGPDFAIVGGIEPTEFLNLSPAQLEPYVEAVIAAAAGGPFVLANSDSCPPGVAVEKFRLVAEIARRHG